MGAALLSSDSATGALVTTLLALVVVCALAYVLLRWLASRGLGGLRRGEHLQVIERVPLDFKNALYVVRGRGRTWLVATGEGSAPRLLTELDPTANEAETQRDG